ncbi:MAG TPA: UDP-glucuronic acid decarboxylase family protein [Patescibacteria group bacterium]|nr:UDP-glucuronic acid decarboxylase family protein [Patescibacteria group bacterium]
MSKVLVTGGAGFIGSHLCDRLLAEGHRVICLDNFFTGSRKNIEHHLNDKNFELIEGDITEPYDNGPVDEIYNLACPASPIHYVKDPVETVRTNVLGMANMLEYARKHQAKILQASTSEVYGDPEVHPQTEDYWGHVNPLGPRSCYDEGKRCAETLCYDYKQRYKLDVKIARIFNTYGPRMMFNDGRALPNFIKQSLTDEPLTVSGDGSQTRSLMYIDDLLDGLIKLMAKKNYFGPVNLGNPNKEITMKQLAEEIVRLCDSGSSIEYYPLPQDDPVKRRPDISRALEVLGWQPRVDFSAGLEKTIVDFKKRLELK